MSSEPRDTDPRPHSLPALARRLGAPLLTQFVKFGMVGVCNTLLTFAVYTLLLKVFGVWSLAASAIGFGAGTVNSFLLNRSWTFRGHVGDALTPVRWAIVQGCGLGINLGLLYVFVHDAGLDKLLAQVFATAVVTISTFFANRAWTFRGHAPVAADDGPARVGREGPGATVRRSSRRAPRSSSRCSITSRVTARSKLSAAKGISRTEPATTSPTPRARARQTLVSETSMPVTVPCLASSSMLRPLPQPASTMRARAGRPIPAITPSSTVRRPRYHQCRSSA